MYPTNTMKSMLVHPKDKAPNERQCETIYHITYIDDPKHTYVGKSKQPLGVRFKKHTKLDRPSWVSEHCLKTGHTNTKVPERELDWHRRKVKEAIHIRQRRPTMNRDQGYQLQPIYDEIFPPMSEPFHRQDISMWSRLATASRNVRSANPCSKVSTIYY